MRLLPGIFRAEDLPGEAFVGPAEALLTAGFTAGQRSVGGTIGKEIGGATTRDGVAWPWCAPALCVGAAWSVRFLQRVVMLDGPVDRVHAQVAHQERLGHLLRAGGPEHATQLELRIRELVEVEA